MTKKSPPAVRMRTQITVDAALSAAIEDYRFTHRVGSQAEAIRQLIRRGVEAAAKKPPRRSASRSDG